MESLSLKSNQSKV